MKRVCIWEFGNSTYRIQEHHGILQADKKVCGRFSDAVLLTEHATGDFDVVVTEKYLHCVCRTRCNVLYFLFDGTDWHKKILASGDILYHDLRLFAHGNFVHFLYSLEQDGKTVFLHRLLGECNVAPSVIETDAVFCSAALHPNGDLTVLYSHNETLRLKQFVWSQKAFCSSHPLELGCYPSCAALHIWNNRIFVAGFASTGSFVNLLCGEFTPSGESLCLAAVHLLCGKEEALCFSETGNKLMLCWCESGSPLSSEYQKPGHWSSPMRYLPVKGREHLLISTPRGTHLGYLEKDTPAYIL